MSAVTQNKRAPESSAPDTTSRKEQHEALLLLLCLVEHVNAASAAMRRNESAAGAQPVFLEHVVDKARSQLRQPKPAWARTALLDALRSHGLVPAFDATLIEAQGQWLAEHVSRRNDGSRAHRRTLPETRRMTVHWRESEAVTQLAAESAAERKRETLRRKILTDETLDPFVIAREYMRKTLDVRPDLVDYELLRFIRRHFGLKFRRHYALLANLCARLNYEYYQREASASATGYEARTPLVELGALLQLIGTELLDSTEDFEPTYRDFVLPDVPLCALGFFMALRFCQTMRMQYEATEAGDGTRDQPQRVGVTLLRPLEYTALRSRIFGSLSGIENLSEIFGGGLLPGVELGRVWVVAGSAGSGKTSLALHLAADLAARDHLVIYFSFEESYRNITDRALAFRLYQADRFLVDAAAGNLRERISTAHADEQQRGLLLYYRETQYDLNKTLLAIRAAVDEHAERWATSTAIIIDSVDALDQGNDAGEQDRSGRRASLRQLFRLLEEAKFSTLILAERGNPELATLQHLADTYIEVGVDDSTAARWLQIHKCRIQDFMGGKHGYSLRDGSGVSLVPNLGAVQRIIRRRAPAALSENRVIALPEELARELPTPVIQEKSSTLLWGNDNAAMTAFWISLLTEPSRHVPTGDRNHLRDPDYLRKNLHTWIREPLASVVVISFRTSPARFRQNLRGRQHLQSRWDLVPRKYLHWYQPEPDLSAAQVICDLRHTIEEARIEGTPIDRIVFDAIDAIDTLLPNLAKEPAFWPTVFGLLSTEPLTAVYIVATDDDREPKFSEHFAAGTDYVFQFAREPMRTGPLKASRRGFETKLSMYKHTDQLSDKTVQIGLSADGALSVSTATRDARLDDAIHIAAVEVRSWQTTYKGHMPDAFLDGLSITQHADIWHGRLENNETDILAIEDESGRLVGFCSLGHSSDPDATPNTGELSAIHVESESWRQRVGARLVSDVILRAQKRGFKSLTLWVLDANQVARLFYEKLGFQLDGAEKWNDRWGDFLVHQLRYRLPLPHRADA